MATARTNPAGPSERTLTEEEASVGRSRVLTRALAGIGALVAIGIAFAILADGSVGSFWIGLVALPAVMAALLIAYAGGGRSARVRKVLRSGILGGVTLGTVTFLAGFIYALVAYPDAAADGAELAFFVTGPLGAVIGAVGGSLWATFAEIRKRKSRGG